MPGAILPPANVNRVGERPLSSRTTCESPGTVRFIVRTAIVPEISGMLLPIFTQPTREPIDVVAIGKVNVPVPANGPAQTNPVILIVASCRKWSCTPSAGAPSPEWTTLTSAVSPLFASTTMSGANVSDPPAPRASPLQPGVKITATTTPTAMIGSVSRINRRLVGSLPSPRKSPSCRCPAYRSAGMPRGRSRY